MDDRGKEFMKELIALLKKYDGEIEAEDHYVGYAECGEDVRMTVYLHGYHVAGTGEYVPSSTIDLGRCLTYGD